MRPHAPGSSNRGPGYAGMMQGAGTRAFSCWASQPPWPSLSTVVAVHLGIMMILLEDAAGALITDTGYERIRTEHLVHIIATVQHRFFVSPCCLE